MQGALAQSQLDDFRAQVGKRRRVLRKLGHLNDDGMLSVKGKAAAEVRASAYLRRGCVTR